MDKHFINLKNEQKKKNENDKKNLAGKFNFCTEEKK